MPKLCQLIATFGVVWVIVMLAEVPPIVALPADTTPPTGWAWMPAPQAISREKARIFSLKLPSPPQAEVQDEMFLPALLVFSDTATKVLVWSFQIDR